MPAMSHVGLPDDVVDVIFSQAGHGELQLLGLCSKGWHALVEWDGEWKRRWQAGKHHLSRSRLAACRSWKDRVAWVHRARYNMINGIGELYQIAEPQLVDSFATVTHRRIPTVRGSFYAGFTLSMSSYSGGSGSTTSRLHHAILDFRNWPCVERLRVPARPISTIVPVGDKFAYLPGKHIVDMSEWITNPKQQPLKSEIPAISERGRESLGNANPNFPWVLIHSPRGQAQPRFWLLDIITNTFILEGVNVEPLPQNYWIVGNFDGPYFTVNYGQFHQLFKIDIESKTIRPQADLAPVFGMSFLDIFDGKIFRFSGGSFSWCGFESVIEGSKASRDELERNKIHVHGPTAGALKPSVGNELLLCHSARHLGIYDLKLKEPIAHYWSAQIASSVWLDDTLILLEHDTAAFVIDFAPPVTNKLPVWSCNTAVLIADATGGNRRVSFLPPDGTSLEKVLSTTLGSNWKTEATLTCLDQPDKAEEHKGIQKIGKTIFMFSLRETTVEQERQQVSGFVSVWDKQNGTDFAKISAEQAKTQTPARSPVGFFDSIAIANTPTNFSTNFSLESGETVVAVALSAIFKKPPYSSWGSSYLYYEITEAEAWEIFNKIPQ